MLGRCPTILIDVNLPLNKSVFHSQDERFEWNLLLMGCHLFNRFMLGPTTTLGKCSSGQFSDLRERV